jgi:hypothetical protein
MRIKEIYMINAGCDCNFVSTDKLRLEAIEMGK